MLHTSTKECLPTTEIFPVTEGLIEFADAKPASVTVQGKQPESSRRQLDAQESPRQARYMRRLLVIGGFALLYHATLTICYTLNLINGFTLVFTAIAATTAVFSFYLVFKTGLNRSLKEKTLTLPICATAFAILIGTVWIDPESRAVCQPFIFIVATYGVYRLPQKIMLQLIGIALAAWAGIIGIHYVQGIDARTLQLELLEWSVLIVTLPAFILLAGRVRRLHSALYKAGLKIRNIEEHARRDQLLGCYNRRYMIAVLEEQKRLADDNGEPLCLAVIDLDHFKSINDEAGHLVGDDVLRTFSQIAQANVRQEDVFGRYGGEEFLLVLPQTSLLAALNTAERIREQVECHGWKHLLRRPVTVSIGLTQYIPGESVLDLFSRTDTAMYLAKRGGRNQVVVEEPAQEMWQAADS